MKAFDRIHNCTLEVTREELIQLMQTDRQIDLEFEKSRTDGDGYLTWDAENWTCVDGRRFIRCYSLKGRVLRDSTTHNTYDMFNDFFPDQAQKIQVN